VILIVSNAQDVTANFFQERLEAAAVGFVRLNTERLAQVPLTYSVDGAKDDRVCGTFVLDGQRVRLTDIRSVYYRRPVAPEFPATLAPGLRDWMENETRRAWGGVLAASPQVRWINDPLCVSRASYKPEQMARAKRMGLRVPDTLITSEPAQARAFCKRQNWQVVAKPIGHGEILGDSEDDDRIIYTNMVPETAAQRFDEVASCPTLFQQAIAKDVDLRVTIVDDEVIPVELHSQERAVSIIDCRRDNMSGMRYSCAELPGALTQELIRLVQSYGLHYAAIDLVRDPAGRHWFLELNPAGQWAWLEQAADVPISSALIRCLTKNG